jgi:hypothetical protein
MKQFAILLLLLPSVTCVAQTVIEETYQKGFYYQKLETGLVDSLTAVERLSKVDTIKDEQKKKEEYQKLWKLRETPKRPEE